MTGNNTRNTKRRLCLGCGELIGDEQVCIGYAGFYWHSRCFVVEEALDIGMALNTFQKDKT